MFGSLAVGLLSGLDVGLLYGLVEGLLSGLLHGPAFGLVGGLVFGLVWWPFKRSAVGSRLSLVWPSTRRQLLNFLRRAGRGLVLGLIFGLVVGLMFGLIFGVSFLLLIGEGAVEGLLYGLAEVLVIGLVIGLVFGLIFGLVMALGFGLLQTRTVLTTSRTPKEARSRSLIAALTWLLSVLLSVLLLALGIFGLVGLGLAQVNTQGGPPGPYGLAWLLIGLTFFVVPGLFAGLVLGLRNGGWFVLLQNIAHRRLARARNLPAGPYDFLEWGIERQLFRRVGGGVRFRHNLIQQHLANTSEGVS